MRRALEWCDWGCHRNVLLVGRYALKTPVMNGALRWWVRGWLVNLDEAEQWRSTQDPGLCPVLFSFFGLVNVQPRCDEAGDVREYEVTRARAAFEARRGHECTAEPFAKSYGRLDGRVVAFDYGRVA